MESINKSEKQKKLINYIMIFLLFVVGIILIILPANFFDTGPPMCISVLLLEKECYGCGMTRAIQHLIHFEFDEAYHFNKLSFIVFPLTIYMIIWEFKKRLMIAKDKK